MPPDTQAVRVAVLSKEFQVRSLFVALLVIGFVCQHFTCCCEASCAVACECTENAGHDSIKRICLHHESCCHEDDSESPKPVNDESKHEHHFCVGTHLFYLTTTDLAVDFTPQLCWFAILPDVSSVVTPFISGTVNLTSAAPSIRSTSQRLRAQLCVYSI